MTIEKLPHDRQFLILKFVVNKKPTFKMELDKDNFEKTVNGSKPVIVDYWASWCGPCKMIDPIFEAVSKQVAQATFAKVNVDENTQLASDQGIMNIPCIVIYKKGEELDRIVGVQTEQQLKTRIMQAIS